jgi:4a-hydroxytetrahydrobiopterin dehydratase
VAKLADDELDSRLAALPEWRRNDSTMIVRDLHFANFARAIEFVNEVADAAEAAGHHPDIFVHDWNLVRLTLWTHTEGGVTDADLALAGRIDELA